MRFASNVLRMVAAVLRTQGLVRHLADSGRLLVSVCDTGSANAIAPILIQLRFPFDVVAQGHAAKVLDRWRIPYTLVSQSSWKELLELGKHILREYQPRAVLSGTSWGATVDKAVTIAAREQSIVCASLIEHWDLYRERFSVITEGLVTEQDKYLPDWIWVSDELAYTEAAAVGLPVSKFKVVGQPHLENQLQQLKSLSCHERDNTVVFVSERIYEDFPPGTPMYRGFDEYKVLAGVIKVATHLDQKIRLKLHPQEPRNKYDQFLKQDGRIEVIEGVNNIEIIASAGRIVGMCSMLLLEAALVRPDVISFIPDSNPDIFVGNRLSATLTATNVTDLQTLMTLEYPGMSKTVECNTPFASKFVGSADRMMQAIEDMLMT